MKGYMIHAGGCMVRLAAAIPECLGKPLPLFFERHEAEAWLAENRSHIRHNCAENLRVIEVVVAPLDELAKIVREAIQ